MTVIEINLPDELAQRAKSAGLLSDSALQGSWKTRYDARADECSWIWQEPSTRRISRA
jgi:hypothetical protein